MDSTLEMVGMTKRKAMDTGIFVNAPSFFDCCACILLIIACDISTLAGWRRTDREGPRWAEKAG